MEEYIFEPKEIVIHWLIRLRSWFIALHDNRALYKQFTTELHLDKLEKEEISFNLPKKYPIATNELSQLYEIRDRILIKIHQKDYSNKQVAIDNRLKELEDEYEMLKTSRANEKNDLDRFRTKLKTIKESEDYIAMESRISKAESKLQNTDATLKNCKDQVAKLIHKKKENTANWRKQVKSVEKTIGIAVDRYIKKATRKIETRYGFTNFTHIVNKYDNEMERIEKGEY